MGRLNVEQVKQYALQRLEKELSPKLLYHGVQDTHDEVVPAAERLADMEGMQGDPRAMLVTGAWFHGLGFIEVVTGHESVSARLVCDVLPGFGYTVEQIEVVKGIIMATVVANLRKPTLKKSWRTLTWMCRDVTILCAPMKICAANLLCLGRNTATWIDI